MKPITRINYLIDQHGDSFTTCKGCLICEEIQQIRKSLERDPVEKCNRVLKKGQSMTVTDIKYLITNDVPREKIRQSLQMHKVAFHKMMKDLGIESGRLVKEEEKVSKSKIQMTAEEFVQWKYVEKLSLGAIGKKFGVGNAAVHYWKENRKAEIETALKALYLLETEEVKIISKINENPEFDENTKELATKLTDAENLLAEKDKYLNELEVKVQELESVSAACSDVEEETANLRKQVECLEETLSLAKEKLKSKSEDIDTLYSKISDAQKTLVRFESENKALRALVALWI